MKFPIRKFFSKCGQISSVLRIWSHLLKKSFIENFTFCSVIHAELKGFCSSYCEYSIRYVFLQAKQKCLVHFGLCEPYLLLSNGNVRPNKRFLQEVVLVFQLQIIQFYIAKVIIWKNNGLKIWLCFYLFLWLPQKQFEI